MAEIETEFDEQELQETAAEEERLKGLLVETHRKRKAIIDHIDGLYADLKSTANIARSDSRGILLHVLQLMKQLAELL